MREDGRPTAADRRVALWLVLIGFLLGVLLSHGYLTSSDEISVFEETQSLWQRGDLTVGPGPHVFRGPDGNIYSHFAEGQAVLALPFYGLARLAAHTLPEAWLRGLAGPRRKPEGRAGGRIEVFAVQLYPPLATGVLLALFFLFERALGATLASAALAALLLGTTTYVLPMSTYFLCHTSEAITILGGFYGLHRYRRNGRPATLLWASALASLTLLVRVPAVMAAPGLAGYLAWSLHRRAREGDPRRRVAAAAASAALPALLVLAVHVGLNHLKWGTWLASPMTGQSVYFTTPLRVGARGLLLSPGASVFLYSPLLLLSPWLLARLWRTHRAECAAVLVVAGTFLVVCGRFWSWSGLWAAPGPRYLFVWTPLLLLPLGPWLDDLRARGSRAGLAAVAGLALAGAACAFVVAAASWRTVVELMDYKRWEPGMEFLFIASQSPILGSARAVARGYLDPWLWWLAIGWHREAPHPLVALLLAAALLAALAACLLRLRRAVREPARAGASGESGGASGLS